VGEMGLERKREGVVHMGHPIGLSDGGLHMHMHGWCG
jgi:hypothetical protein